MRLPDGARIVDVEVIRERAPKVLAAGETLDFQTMLPAKGGLFDPRVFGAGTVIDAPVKLDDSPYVPRKTQFARIALARPIAHIVELPVLPPDLRPLHLDADDRWQPTPLNNWYRRIFNLNRRLASDPSAEPELFAVIRGLFENDELPDPELDKFGTPIPSLRSIVGGSTGFAFAAEAETTRGYIARSVLFAMCIHF